MNVADVEVGLSQEELRETWSTMEVGERAKKSGRHRRKDDLTFPIEVWVDKTEIGGEKRFVALGRDVTEQLERERKLEALADRPHFGSAGEASRTCPPAAQAGTGHGDNASRRAPDTDDGPLRYIRVYKPVTGPDRSVRSIVGCGLNITSRVQSDERLRAAKEAAEAAQKKAEEASQMKSAFLADVSHEARTLFTTIVGFAEAVESGTNSLDVPGSGSLAEYARRIEKGESAR